jgi:DnaJ-class molecular chaperone
MVQELDCTLEEIYLGSKKQVRIQRFATCKSCNGYGCAKGIDTTCKKCHGKGMMFHTMKRGYMVSQTQEPCSSCNGTGKFIPFKSRCASCKGSGSIKENKLLEVTIPRGAESGETIRLKGVGQEEPGCKVGDVVFVIKEIVHPFYQRQSNYLYTHLEISLAEAICGFHRMIETLDHRKLEISTKPGEVINVCFLFLFVTCSQKV